MPSNQLRISWWDRLLIGIAPDWGMRRVRARAATQMMARHYEAAQGGRRTSGWHRSSSDANTANGPALASLRELSRDLLRNNGWARRGIETIVNNTVGWGIAPKPHGRARAQAKAALELWKEWAESTACDYDGRLSFYGLERLAMETIALSGEVLIVRQPAATKDGLAIPLRIQVLEPDYLDTARHGLPGLDGGEIIHGVEFDAHGRRVAYYLFSSHPGGSRLASLRLDSVRVPADRVIHIYRVDRPGQVRGVPWLATAIARLKDFDDYEDAELMQQKIAACFGAFVTDMDGASVAIGEQSKTDARLETLEPGHIEYLPPGKTVQFATPPRVQDTAFTTRTLRRIAAGLGVTYEDMTGDYSQVNFSSARMARLAHWANVRTWRWIMLVPQLCDGVWRWAMELAAQMEGWSSIPRVQWSAPPMPILEPDREGLAYQRLVRIGGMTWAQMVSELGEDPSAQLDEIEWLNGELDRRGIVIDCDPRRTTAAGQQQAIVPATKPAAKPTAKPTDKKAEDTDDPASPSAEDTEQPDPERPNEANNTDEDEPMRKPQSDEPRVFAYHQPFMRANEIREGIGLPGDAEDGELFALEFVAKHGGNPNSSGAAGGESTEA